VRAHGDEAGSFPANDSLLCFIDGIPARLQGWARALRYFASIQRTGPQARSGQPPPAVGSLQLRRAADFNSASAAGFVYTRANTPARHFLAARALQSSRRIACGTRRPWIETPAG